MVPSHCRNRQLWFLAMIAAAAAIAQATLGCKDYCGNLSIPFPFGTSKDCYLNEDFFITCNASNVALLGNTSTQVLSISLQGQLRISAEVAVDCYNKSGSIIKNVGVSFETSKFPISYTENKFTAVGCDTYALVGGTLGHNYTTGCVSYCQHTVDVVNGSCNGIGCCQTSFPKGVWGFEVYVTSFNDHIDVWKFNPCSYAFVAEERAYNFSALDLANLRKAQTFPVVLDWAIGNETCNDARNNLDTYACKNNSICYDADNGPGYRCKCPDGYVGNPYLVNGCEDVDECNQGLHRCSDLCINTIGNHTCACPKGYHGDGSKDGSGCTPNQMIHVVSIIGASAGLTSLFVLLSIYVFGVQKSKMMKLRKEYFKQNGGFLLQQLLFKSKNSEDAAKIFAEDELKKATNNFDQNMVIGQGGYGVVYKGILSDNRIVAIKKSKAIDRTQIEQFVNEVIVLSQLDHPNAVKLLGCCLETPVPLLVYEFITNGTLYYHLHNAEGLQSLSFVTRLRIAEETARALAYMHSLQIIHRDVKSANILLDDNYTAKVSDFGVSRLVPFDQDQISTIVQGTLGYMDPEYFQSGILTEKSDVYSFGVVLAELLTGKKAICSDCEQKSLALYFISSLKEDRLLKVVEDPVRKDGNSEQLKRVAELARRCLRLEGEQRPTMEEVRREVESLRQLEKPPQMTVV